MFNVLSVLGSIDRERLYIFSIYYVWYNVHSIIKENNFKFWIMHDNLSFHARLDPSNQRPWRFVTNLHNSFWLLNLATLWPNSDAAYASSYLSFTQKYKIRYSTLPRFPSEFSFHRREKPENNHAAEDEKRRNGCSCTEDSFQARRSRRWPIALHFDRWQKPQTPDNTECSHSYIT